MNRRAFIRSLGSFVALAVVPAKLIALPRDDSLALLKAAQEGYISGQSFLITRPTVIDVRRQLTIYGCRFIFLDEGHLELNGRPEFRWLISHCHFDGSRLARPAMKFAGNSTYILPADA